MASTLVVPELSESVTEARVGRWMKKEGDSVSAGDALVELETDKVDLEVGAETSGVLSKILHHEGDEVHEGDELAVIEPVKDGGGDRDEREDRGERDATSAERSTEARQRPERDKGTKAEIENEEAVDEEEEEVEEEEEAKDGAKPRRDDDDKPASPSARRLARERDVDLAAVGTETERDRIGRKDVERFLERRQRGDEGASGRRGDEGASGRRGDEEPREHDGSKRYEGRPEELVPMSGRRRTIARRLVEAQRSAAMLTTFNEIDMTALMALRSSQQESFVERHGVRLGIVSFFVRASIGALRSFPRLNAEVRGDDMLVKGYYDIGVAVGDPEGLVVPVLRDADRMPLSEIERRIKDLATRAKEGRLEPEMLSGGTFTITNGGVFGSLLSTPILNPPQVGILGLHKIEDRPYVVAGRVQIGPMMYVALSYDHRIVDGFESVQFLARVKELVESPERLLLEG